LVSDLSESWDVEILEVGGEKEDGQKEKKRK
jgi:hypothetical protein